MMDMMLRYSLLAVISMYLVLIFYLMKQNRFSFRYGMLWLFSGFVMLVFTLFPELLMSLTRFLGIKVASNGLFAICIFLIIMMLVYMTVIVTDIMLRIKKLAQKSAIMEKRLRELEKLEHALDLKKQERKNEELDVAVDSENKKRVQGVKTRRVKIKKEG